ncbi:uncharacterized protein LOC126750080 [Anthonomus grandis grandis]|uniref:uncharacterized protein LOC126750080 n=1 Tax=Anthonomus grandis grandis TaxID=2921223 RepID=UPI00216628B1|nr:uncharacterized protein LOC126750080 [Anthonomus grandis grandis]
MATQLTASQSEKLNRLTYQRNAVSNSLKESYAVALSAKTDENLICEVKARYDDTVNDFQTFRELHNSIIGMTASLGDEEFQRQDELRAGSSVNAMAFQPAHKSIKLEPLSLKAFTGDFKEWRTFFDMFNSCVHNDLELSVIDKFRYLLKYLDGEPLALARSLPLTEDNYAIAYNALIKKYENHSSAHNVKDCTTSQGCNSCGNRHNTLLHFAKTHSTQVNPSPAEEVQNMGVTNLVDHIPVGTTLVESTASIPILPTAIVELKDSKGIFLPVRALIDSGAAACFISNECLLRLGLSYQKYQIDISGIGNTARTTSKGITECIIKPHFSPEPKFSMKVLVLPEICSQLPHRMVNTEHIKNLDTFELADAQFWRPGRIDLLIGAEMFPFIVKSCKPMDSIDHPLFLETVFGWVIMGNGKPLENSSNSSRLCLTANCLTLESLDEHLKRLWELDNIPLKKIESPEATFCEEFYSNTYARDPASNKYVVALPFRIKDHIFGESRHLALRRLYSLENRIYKDSSLLQGYKCFMQEYLDSGYMSLISSNQHNSNTYYIPHHCVIKEESVSTKLRVVFDASMKSSAGISLNDTLYAGPKLHSDIATVLLHFRLNKFCLIADIRKMFLQILVRKGDRRFQRILWRFNREDFVQEYELNTVVFGVTSSPYLANRTIQQLAMDEKESFPIASEILLKNIFVDDILSGCQTLDMAIKIKGELTNLLKRGGFDLRKWASNCPDILSGTPIEHQQPISFDTEEPSCLKVLGLQWQPSLDNFVYQIRETSGDVCTKRSILSSLARIFDPLSMISPLTMYAKILIQDLWKLGMDWNENSPPDITRRWKRFQSELGLLSSIKIPRHIPVIEAESEVHALCDASEKGYAGVIYFRVLVEEECQVFFVIGKSKVAPLKKITLPRLELCAAVLLSNLLEFVIGALGDKLLISNIYAWSDSKVTLSWIKSSAHRWHTFVSNRVSHIQERVSPEKWRYVPTGENPADCASRGLCPADLTGYSAWFNGPLFLRLSSEHWPINNHFTVNNAEEYLQEEKRVVLTSLKLLERDGLLYKYSSLQKILRVLGYCYRWVKTFRRTKNKEPHVIGKFCENDLQEALMCLVKQVQEEVFSEVISNLRKGNPISKGLRQLNPFLDEHGFLRVGGRLTNSTLSYDKKFPLLLPQRHRLTELLIVDIHEKHLHPGLRTLHSFIVQQFWILSAKRAINRCLS